MPDDVLSRLTDPSKYTGSHKNRFDSTGKGKGIEGRVDRHDNNGYVSGFKNEKAPQTTKPVKSSVVDRLTDPSKYTGAHKSRFDSEGRGLGVNQVLDKDVPRDLSDMTRPALHKSPTKSTSSVPKSTSSPSTGGTSPTKTRTTSPKKKAGGPSIFDKLTDTSQYTGTHKNRFDATGKGKGIDGRVERHDNTGYVQGAKLAPK